MIAIVEAYKAGILAPKNLKTNLIAGIVVGVVALPLSMAFAIASGVKPEQGIYTAIIAGLIGALFGGSRVQVSGPAGAFIVILAGITAKYGIAGLQIATAMAGVILLIMGLLRLGNVIKLIPYPVIVGFTSAIGGIIFIGQIKYFFGLKVSTPIDAHFVERVKDLFNAAPTVHLPTTLLSILSLILVIYTPKLIKGVPGPLMALVVATILQTYFQFDGITTIGSLYGGIPQNLPSFELPTLGTLQIEDLVGSAFIIALLGAIESLLCAAAADSMTGVKHNSNQELIGQGLSNLICPFFGGFAATGTIARTATNIRYGGTSPISSIVHSILLIAVLLVLAPYAYYIPFSALAAILFVVAYNMSDIPEFSHIARKSHSHDMLMMVITFLLTLFIDLVVGVGVGVTAGLLLFMMRMTKSVNVQRKSFKELNLAPKAGHAPGDGLIFYIDGPLFFGVAEKVETALKVTDTDPKYVVFSFRNVPFIDMSGIESLRNIIEQYEKRSVVVYLCEANHKVASSLQKMGLTDLVAGKKVFESLDSHFIPANQDETEQVKTNKTS